MSFFADTDQFYTCTKDLFARVEQQDPGAGDAILASHLVIRLRCTKPDGEITLNGRKRPLEWTFGPTRVRPTLDIELAADTLHEIMLGDLSMKRALADGSLKVRGPIWRVTVLADLFYKGQELYPQVLRDNGFDPDA